MAKRRGPVSKTGVPPKPKAVDPAAFDRQRNQQARADRAAREQAHRAKLDREYEASRAAHRRNADAPDTGTIVGID